MREFRSPTWRAPAASLPAALAVLLATNLLALAQPAPSPHADPFGILNQQPPGNPLGTPTTSQRPPQQQKQAPVASPVIARVEGRAITQADFDRIALPYFASLMGQSEKSLTPDMRKLASLQVRDELIRRELLAIESQRQKVEVSPTEVDALLMQDPFFLTDGKFDPAKFNRYKTDPGSNYPQILPRLRETVAMRKLDESLRRRFTPTPAQVRAEWTRRSEQVRFAVLPLLLREMPIEPEATEAEWAQYYQAHPELFVRKTRVRLRYARLAVPAEGDSTRAALQSKALGRARAMADSLRRGTLSDTSSELTDSGLFEIPAVAIPGLGAATALTDTLAKVDQDSTIRVVGPYTVLDAVIVGVVAQRQPKHLPAIREVLGEVKRRADVEKRRVTQEVERHAFYDANRERWRGTRVSLTRVTFDPSTIAVKPPSPQEVERWYAQHGRSLFGMADTLKAWLPPISDSLRAAAGAHMTDAQRSQRVAEAMSRIVAAMRTTRDPRSLAKANGATAETLTFVKGSARDTLFDPTFMDSLLASAVKGTINGPRAFRTRWAAWRVDAVDTSFVPPYEAARVRSDREFAEERRRKDEAEARTYFDGHRELYKTPVKHALDYVAVRIPQPDSVRILESEIRRQYDANPKQYRQDEQIKARHILFMTRDAGPDVEKKAKARADSLLEAIRKDGGDFAELAKRFSQEPGAATSGGDLGWFGRGRMVKEFEEAAFGLKPGEVSRVVKTQFGYHIIKLEERKAPGMKPFDEARREIRAQMAQSRGDSTARRSANALRRRLALGGDPKTLAASHGGVVSAAPIATSETLPEIGFVQGLAQDLPAMAAGRWAQGVYRASNHYLVLRVRERVAPRPAEFEEAKAQANADAMNAKRRAVLSLKVDAIRAALSTGASLDSLAAPYGGIKDIGFVPQTARFVPMLGTEPRVVQKAFAMKPGEVSDTLQVSAGVAWMRVEERKSGDPATLKTVSTQIEGELRKKRYDEWVEEKKKTVKIEILRPDLNGQGPSPFQVSMLSMGG